MKRRSFAPGEYQHLYNRGVSKQVVFHDQRDYYRFLFLILYFQSPVNFPQVGRAVEDFVKHRMLDNYQEIVKKRTIELVAFCIMPNHFHLIVKELEEGGVSTYMQRVLNAYSKYYNTKYDKSGHVFQGAYQSVHITDDRQLKYTSSYIHRNSRELAKWRNNFEDYIWSSCQDVIASNRWGDLLKAEILLEETGGKEKYRKFLKTSTAKLSEKELKYLSLM